MLGKTYAFTFILLDIGWIDRAGRLLRPFILPTIDKCRGKRFRIDRLALRHLVRLLLVVILTAL
jgi:hypothetical protein